MGTLTPFTITIGVCAILGLALLVVPVLTFKSEEYVTGMYTSEPQQFALAQTGHFDTLLVSSNEPRNVSVRVYAPDALPNATERMERVTHVHEATLAPGAVLAVPFLAARGAVTNVTASGPAGSALTLAAVDRAAYRHAHGHPAPQTKPASQPALPEVRHAAFGAHYAVVANAGTAPAHVVFRVVVTSPVYNVTAPSPAPVAECLPDAASQCKLQHLPRGYIAFVDIDTRHGPANRLDATVQLADAIRWGVPVALYAALLLVVVIACIVKLVRHIHRRRTTIRYTAINDPDVGSLPA